jgi:hypothetical protein
MKTFKIIDRFPVLSHAADLSPVRFRQVASAYRRAFEHLESLEDASVAAEPNSLRHHSYHITIDQAVRGDDFDASRLTLTTTVDVRDFPTDLPRTALGRLLARLFS